MRILIGSIPPNGIEFELTLKPVLGLDMVASDGYNAEGWKFTGEELIEPQTRRFKLESLDNCSSVYRARQKLTLPGQAPAKGQWREAFKEAFPQNDSNGPVGCADPSWMGPSGRPVFPVLDGDSENWYSRFLRASSNLLDGYRWLVKIKN